MGDRLRAGKPSQWYVTCHLGDMLHLIVNSAFRPSGVGKSSTDLSGWG